MLHPLSNKRGARPSALVASSSLRMWQLVLFTQRRGGHRFLHELPRRRCPLAVSLAGMSRRRLGRMSHLVNSQWKAKEIKRLSGSSLLLAACNT
eukprot:6201673-Pleurochrysis_carterae.AAC.1